MSEANGKQPEKPVVVSVGNNGKKLGGASGKGFMPGKSGNPNGRPTDAISFRKLVREFLGSKAPKCINKTKIEKLLDDAFKDKDRNFFIKLIAYGYGEPISKLELSGPDGGPIATKDESDVKRLSVDELKQIASGRFKVASSQRN